MPAVAVPLRAWWRAVPPLTVGITFSLVLHVAVLSLHFKFPDASRFMREQAMDIILVNARSAHKPVKAQALAQANLDGGGDTDDDRRAKTPLPPSAQQVDGDDVATLRKRAHELEAQQLQLLAQAKSLRTQAASQSGQGRSEPQAVSGLDLVESARAMARLEGEISKSVEEYNKRPRKKFIGARTEEYGLAAYISAVESKVTRVGTLNYPESAKGKIYGKVLVFIELKADDGEIYSVEIRRSSGHKILDDAALRILRMSAPFGSIPRKELGGATVLGFARVINFVNDFALSAQ